MSEPSQQPTSRRKWKALGICIGVILTLVFLPPLIVPLFVPWNRINCRHELINIKTGQAKFQRFLWYCMISESIEDTPISEALDGEVVDVADIPAWCTVNTFSPWTRHSPHYCFHSALWQIFVIRGYFEAYHPSPEKKREIARKILTLWQKSGNDFSADNYIEKELGKRTTDK